MNINQTIWKFQLPFIEITTLHLPTQSEVLCVQLDKKTNAPCLWVLVYPNNPREVRTFELFGTGVSIHNDMGVERKYIGTYQYQRGQYIGHVFERTSL